MLIVGGGIGGLALAVALGRANRSATLLERSQFAEEAGAGIQLAPNATRILHRLGVLDAIERVSSRPEALCIFDALSGRKLATLPLGKEAEARYGAPYLTLRRADLHARLLEAAGELEAITLRCGFDAESIEQTGRTVSVRNRGGERAEGAALVGADGLWSVVRGFVSAGAAPRFAGETAWRALIPHSDLPDPVQPSIVGLWLAPHAHLVHYPVRGGEEINLVLVMDGGAPISGWSEPGDRRQLLARFPRWAKNALDLLEAAQDWRGWSLYGMSPLRRWSNGKLALIGDAAHPVPPHLAQGAALAIEDAATLAACIGADGDNAAAAFRRYQRLRQRRVGRVQLQSGRLGRLYHLHGLPRLVRNILLQRRSAHSSLRRFDWLYEKKLPQVLQDEIAVGPGN